MTSPSRHLTKIVQGFRNRVVGVLGDYMLDELLRGEATRISPEAPVAVVLLGPEDSREGYPGGAGNVAANIRALGGRPVPFGAIGADASGEKLRKLLAARDISCRTLFAEPGRATPRKVRVVALQQQLIRLDFERPARISPAVEAKLARNISRLMSGLDALVISDYRKGTVTTALSELATVLARQRRIPVIVDPKPEHPEICRHATLVTPNLRETETMAGHSMRTPQDVYTHGRRLRAELDCERLLVTRGGEGMTLFEPSGEVHNVPGVKRPVYDVTGAGDTVVAVVALACASGASMREAAELANLAAGRVVLKFGTAEITAHDLMEAIS